MNEEYYVVEVRLPVQISKAISVDDAARKAARIIESQYGVAVNNWYMRVFVYGKDEDGVGVTEEWFSNPAGSKFRRVDENVEKHNNAFENGEEL